MTVIEIEDYDGSTLCHFQIKGTKEDDIVENTTDCNVADVDGDYLTNTDRPLVRVQLFTPRSCLGVVWIVEQHGTLSSETTTEAYNEEENALKRFADIVNSYDEEDVRAIAENVFTKEELKDESPKAIKEMLIERRSFYDEDDGATISMFSVKVE